MKCAMFYFFRTSSLRWETRATAKLTSECLCFNSFEFPAARWNVGLINKCSHWSQLSNNKRHLFTRYYVEYSPHHTKIRDPTQQNCSARAAITSADSTQQNASHVFRCDRGVYRDSNYVYMRVSMRTWILVSLLCALQHQIDNETCLFTFVRL